MLAKPAKWKRFCRTVLQHTRVRWVKVKTLKIDKTEYKIFPMSVHLSVYNDLLAEKQKTRPSTLEEATKQSEIIKQIIDKILAETVNPQPKQGHTLELYQEVINETNIVLERAKFFRSQQK